MAPIAPGKKPEQPTSQTLSLDVGGPRFCPAAALECYRLRVHHPSKTTDPRETLAYTVAEAAVLVRVPVSALKTWTLGHEPARRGFGRLPDMGIFHGGSVTTASDLRIAVL